MRTPARGALCQLARGGVLLAAHTAAWVQAAPRPASTPVQAARSLLIEGGSRDDQAYARAAAGRISDEASFAAALSAVRATDRFRDVQGNLEPGPGPARLRLDPWPLLRSWSLRDDGAGEAPVGRRLFPELRRGIAVGLARREAWRAGAEKVLRASGFPAAEVTLTQAEGGAGLVIDIRRGAPSRILSLALEGHAEPYGEARLWEVVGAQKGRTLWTLAFRREALARLRKRFLKDRRYEWKAEFRFSEGGTLTLQIDPGPEVELRAEGGSLGFGGIAELAPLARAERYSPELLDEGDRRIFRYLRNQGYLDPVVSHRREVLEGPAARPLKVRVTYTLRPGAPVKLAALRFEGNEALTEKELGEAAGLPTGILGWGVPKANPDLLQGLEDRLRALYLRRGFNEARVRRAVPLLEQGRWIQAFIIHEGPRRELAELKVTLPDKAVYDAWAIGEDLLPVLGERPVRRRGLEPSDASARVFESDRPQTAGIHARLERGPAKEGWTSVILKPDRPIPYVRGDLVAAVAALRARLSALGVQKPKEELEFDEAAEGLRIRLTLSDAPRAEVQRLVVQGSDKTKARAVLREAELPPGSPFSPEGLGKSQARIANLGAFQRVDLEALPGPEEGSLALRLSERNPWIFSHSFGYDRSQGYHIGTSIQRLNVGGMGRNLDFGIRAGDATLGSEFLRQAFPTGDYSRSVDNYTLGYTDPRFSPAFLDRWLPDRVQYRAEGAYIVERQSVYEIRRRRLVNTFEWHLNERNLIQVGHRYERAEVQSRIVPIDRIKDTYQRDLFKASKIPDGKVIISAPFIQFVRDARDSPFDPTRGNYFFARLDLANQVFGTSSNSSFVKLDLRHQWNWSVGHNAAIGVVTAGVRIGVADPTASSAENFPLSERFFAGGPFTHRGVEPDGLGPRSSVPILDPNTRDYKYFNAPDGAHQVFDYIPIGGQALALINLEFRFPIYGSWLWGEVFLDSGQVYGSLHPNSEERLVGAAPPFPPFRTSLGAGVIFKLGIPIKIEYAADLKRILGRSRTREEQETELHGVLVSAGFQF